VGASARAQTHPYQEKIWPGVHNQPPTPRLSMCQGGRVTRGSPVTLARGTNHPRPRLPEPDHSPAALPAFNPSRAPAYLARRVRLQ